MTDRRIVTPRLVLEPIPLAAARLLLAGRPVPGLVAGRGWPHEDTLDGLRGGVPAGDEEKTGWFVRLAAKGEVIGDCGWRGGPDEHGDAEIGYGLAAPYRGQGYGRELVGALVGWCLAQPGVRRVTASVLPGNLPSRRVLERAGLAPVGPDGDHLRYATDPALSPLDALRTPRGTGRVKS